MSASGKMDQTVDIASNIPSSHWPFVRFGDLVTRAAGGGTPSTKIAEFWDGPIPWTTSAVIGPDDVYLNRFQRGITESGLRASATNLAPKGSVLLGTRVGVGKAVVTTFDVAISQDLTILELAPELSPEFLVLCLKATVFQRWFDQNKRGTTIKGVPREDVLALRIPLPPLPEQRAIARVLQTVQQAREATEQVIAAARELKKSLMRYLFTYGPVPVEEADKVPLKDTAIGPVPETWKVTTLGGVAKIGNGSTPKRDNPDYWIKGTIPWLNSGKVHEHTIRQADQFVTELARSQCHLPLVPKDSVVVAITGQGKTLGNAAIVLFDTCVSQHLAYVQFKDPSVLPRFALAYLQQRYYDLRRLGQGGGSTKGALTCGLLLQYSIPVPQTNTQERMVRTLQAADAKIQVEEQRLRAEDTLFKTLLDKLMTGKLRVAVGSEAAHAAG